MGMKKQSILLILAMILAMITIGQSSGTFPGEPFNGMQVNYNITGATISKYSDVPGFTWTRSLVIANIQKQECLEYPDHYKPGLWLYCNG